MSQFNLKTVFTNEQLQILYATGTNVVVAKSLNGQPNVAWQVFKPLQNNLLSWKEEYGLYASTSELLNGVILNPFSSISAPIDANTVYTLEPYGTISGPSSGGYPNAYTLANQFSGKYYVTAGLTQNANVNGNDINGNAVSGNPLMLQSSLVATPNTTIYIWLQSQVTSNMVVTVITSPVTALKFGGDVTDISVAYDSSSGRFLQAAAAKGAKISSDIITHIEPTL